VTHDQTWAAVTADYAPLNQLLRRSAHVLPDIQFIGQDCKINYMVLNLESERQMYIICTEGATGALDDLF
jgi:hypothetical protein